MSLSLTAFQESDLDKLDAWCENIKAGQFMSRVTPKQFGRGGSIHNDLWNWYIIEYNHQAVGTVWLEKDTNNSDTAILGILLGAPELLGQGIGTQAILLAIETAQKTLGFSTVRLNVRKSNIRAISCYKKCGFTIVYEGTKSNIANEEILFYTMQRDVIAIKGAL